MLLKKCQMYVVFHTKVTYKNNRKKLNVTYEIHISARTKALKCKGIEIVPIDLVQKKTFALN